ncbi:MAG: GH3 auxin-responsive promoter family protein [Nitrospirae bacterium]|nr:GH3 auxin-responsive promoter family protein [Nitrospirota bacterium]
MFKKLLYFFVNAVLFALWTKPYYCFKKRSASIEKVQRSILLRIVRRNSKTFFGKRHSFNEINNVDAFRMRIPLFTYDTYSAYVDLIREGKQNVLTREPVLALIPSSGSTAPSKYIPFTKGLKQEFLNGISPWMFDLFVNTRKLMFGSTYWSITPVGKNNTKNGRLKIGFDEDGEYLGKVERFFMSKLLSVPKEVSQIKNMEVFRYITLLFLLKDKNLSYVSVWNPTFLMLLLKSTVGWSELLVSDIRDGAITIPVNMDLNLKQTILEKLNRDRKRADELSAVFARWGRRPTVLLEGISLYEAIWPNLTLISCWADGNATRDAHELKTFFPNVKVQPKGLLATEGIVSFPLVGEDGAIVSINSHFFEFIEIEKADTAEEPFQQTKLVHQLQMGKLYSVVITTSGGLYRYRLQDIIKVVGFKNECPLIHFVSKENNISDLFGEKLNEYHVSRVLNEALKNHSLSPSFWMIAPEKGLPDGDYFYTVFLQLSHQSNRVGNLLKSLSEQIEEKLQDNYHYRYCRNLGQLSKLRLFVINSDCNAQETYLRACQSSGQRLGAIKIATLSSKMGWAKTFGGNFV